MYSNSKVRRGFDDTIDRSLSQKIWYPRNSSMAAEWVPKPLSKQGGCWTSFNGHNFSAIDTMSKVFEISKILGGRGGGNVDTMFEFKFQKRANQIQRGKSPSNFPLKLTRVCKTPYGLKIYLTSNLSVQQKSFLQPICTVSLMPNSLRILSTSSILTVTFCLWWWGTCM